MKEYTRQQGGELEVTIPIRLRYDGHKTVINLPEDAPPPLDASTMNPMQKALVQGMRFRDAIEAGEAKSVSDLARKARIEHVFLFHSLEMVNVAPDIVKAILDGSVPDGFTLSLLRKGIPDDWDDQRREFGFQ